MRRPDLVALALLGAALACATGPEDEPARAVSEATWERVRPFLEDLSPGDDLRAFEAARRVELPKGRRQERPVVVIPAWIASLSGGAAGGMSMLGQLTGRSGDVVTGSHVFGFVRGDRIVPRFQVVTRATLVSAAELDRLAREGARHIGALPRPGGVLYFRDLHVAGTRPLDFPAPEDAESRGPPAGSAATFYSEAAYRDVAPVLDALPPGTDLLSLLWILRAEFVSRDGGETHSLHAPGFLQTRTVRSRTVEGPAGVFKLRPFGFVEGERAVVKRIAIFENDRLVEVARHDGRDDWLGYLPATSE